MTAHSTNEVLALMEQEKFDITRGYLDFLWREKHMEKPKVWNRSLMWTDADIAALREALTERGRFLEDEEPRECGTGI